MAAQARTRLPAVPPLSQILPKGTEGGREFARIVDLLIFFDSRRRNVSSMLFSDASGDFAGLDSSEYEEFRLSIQVFSFASV